jgi:hypothetical protein
VDPLGGTPKLNMKAFCTLTTLAKALPWTRQSDRDIQFPNNSMASSPACDCQESGIGGISESYCFLKIRMRSEINLVTVRSD